MNVIEETQKWLRYAQEDLQVAASLLGSEEAHPRHACWLAQQAAEKALSGID